MKTLPPNAQRYVWEPGQLVVMPPAEAEPLKRATDDRIVPTVQAAYVESEHPRDHTGGPGAGEWVAKADTHEANHRNLEAAKQLPKSASLQRYYEERGEEINAYLRRGDFDKPRDRTDAERIQRDFRQGKDVHATDADLVLYRGMGVKQGVPLIGTEFTDRGLTSASTDFDKASLYATIATQPVYARKVGGTYVTSREPILSGLDPVTLRLHLPAGSHVMNGNLNDDELILGPGTAYTVVAQHAPGVYDAIVRPA